MLKSRRPICFIATAEPETAQGFYSDILELELLEVSPYALVFSDGETMLRIQIVAELSPVEHTVHGWDVADIEREIVGLAAKGVEFLRFGPLVQSDLGVWTSPDGHRIAWFKDPSGNMLSLTEFVR